MTSAGNAVLSDMIGHRLQFIGQAFKATGGDPDIKHGDSQVGLFRALHWLSIDWVATGGPVAGDPTILISWEG